MAIIDRKKIASQVIDLGYSELEVARAMCAAGVAVSEAQVARSVYEELRDRGRDFDAARYGTANEGAVYRDGVAENQNTRPPAPHRTDLSVAPIAAALEGVKP